ncbi:MAG: 1-acyl-sn-glycerol-3-phosphate acyltransferase [Pseudomonadota bacterium]
MFETVAIPVWVLWVAGLLALVGALDRILIPSVRWYLRRRLNRAIARLNDRLQLKIQPFKLTQRRVMIDRLAHDPAVVEAALAHAQGEDIPYPVAADMAKKYAREIVPSFSAYAYFGLAIRLARWLSTALYRVRLGQVDEKALSAIDPGATVVFVMNHRSNMDYVLVTYLAATRSALSYAVGEWARVWPLKQLIRTMGAYFIRRRSRNGLYRRVLARYVQMATEAGVTQAIFPEGGLSRDGFLKPAKLGLLNYIVSEFDLETSRDVVFVPVGLNYDRVLEDRVLLAAHQGQPMSKWGQFTTGARFVGKHIWLRVTGRIHRFGYASVSFGRPMSLRAFAQDRTTQSHERMTAELGRALMAEVGRVVPVLPVSLIARVLTRDDPPVQRGDIRAAVEAELEELTRLGAHTHMPRKSLDYAVETGLRMLVLRRALTVEGTGEAACYRLDPAQRALLTYYANGIAHLNAPRGPTRRVPNAGQSADPGAP